MKRLAYLACIGAGTLASAMNGYAETQNPRDKYDLMVYVSDTEGNAVPGIVICTKGKGSPSKATDGSGRTLLILQGEITVGEEIDLVLVADVKENQRWEIVPNFRPLIPAFKPNSYATLLVKKRKAQTEVTSQSNLDLGFGSIQFELTNTYAELVSTYIRLGHSEYGRRRYKEALEAYEKALEFRPNNDELLYYSALSLLQQREYQEALVYIERCLAIREERPESVELADAYELYSSLLGALKRVEEAERHKARASIIRSNLPKQDNKP